MSTEYFWKGMENLNDSAINRKDISFRLKYLKWIYFLEWEQLNMLGESAI
jgi:hypothetical protein